MRQDLLIPGGDFEPTDFGDCKLWLRADAGNISDLGANSIDEWRDRSGNANLAINGTADSTKATFSADEITAGAGAAVFDGTDDYVKIEDRDDSTSIRLGASDFTVVMVIKIGAPVDNIYPIAYSADGTTGGSVNGFHFRHLRSGHRMRFGFKPDTLFSITSATLADPGVFAFVVSVDRSDNLNLYTNGVPATPVAIGTDLTALPNPTAGFWIGSQSDLTNSLNGSIGEILLYDRLLTVAETNQLGAYMATRYGITWTDLV